MNTVAENTANEARIREIEMELLDNPKYSSSWIANAAKIIDTGFVTLNELEDFDAEQLGVIMSVIVGAQADESIPLSPFLDKNLNATQMQLLFKGLSSGLQYEMISDLFDASITYAKLNWIISGLCDGYQMLCYEDFDKDQLYEIYGGFKDGVNVEIYAKKNIEASKMAICRHALALGLKVTIEEDGTIEICNE